MVQCRVRPIFNHLQRHCNTRKKIEESSSHVGHARNNWMDMVLYKRLTVLLIYSTSFIGQIIFVARRIAICLLSVTKAYWLYTHGDFCAFLSVIICTRRPRTKSQVRSYRVEGKLPRPNDGWTRKSRSLFFCSLMTNPNSYNIADVSCIDVFSAMIRFFGMKNAVCDCPESHWLLTPDVSAVLQIKTNYFCDVSPARIGP